MKTWILFVLLAAPWVQANPALLGQAEEAFVNGNHRAVIQLAGQALQADPSAVDARFLRGMSQYQLGNRGLALHELNSYLQTGVNYRQEATDMAELIRGEVGTSVPPANQPLGNQVQQPQYQQPQYNQPQYNQPQYQQPQYQQPQYQQPQYQQPATITPDRQQGIDTRGLLAESRSSIPPASPTGSEPAKLPMRYSLSAGYHYDSRVVLRPENDVPPEEPEISDSALHLRGNVDISPPKDGYIARYDGDWMLYNKASRESRLAQKVELGWHTSFGGSSHDAELVGIADLILLDFEEYRQRFGTALTWANFPEGRRDWAKATLGTDSYDEFPEYDGGYWGADVGQDYILGDLILSWNLGYLDQGADLPEVEFTETHLNLNAIANLSDTVSVGAGGAWVDNPYARFDPVFDQRRDDSFISGQVFLSYALSENLSIEPSVTYIQRSSSVGELDYDRVMVEINTVLTRW